MKAPPILPLLLVAPSLAVPPFKRNGVELAAPRRVQPLTRHARVAAQSSSTASSLLACDADKTKECSWSIIQGACVPMRSCRVVSCGLFTCGCAPISISAQPPWQVLELNVSLALDAHAVRRAFAARARVLSPERNPACLAKAGREYVAARRARDTLLLLAAIKDEQHRPESASSSAPILSVAPKPTKKQWRPARRLPRRAKLYAKQTSSAASLGTQISLVLALKLALCKMLRDYKTKLTRGWWSRASGFVRSVRATLSGALRAAWHFCKEHRAHLLVTLAFWALAAPMLTLA